MKGKGLIFMPISQLKVQSTKKSDRANLHSIQIRKIILSTDVETNQWKSNRDKKQRENEREGCRLSHYVGQNSKSEDVTKYPSTSSIFVQLSLLLGR